MAQGAERKGSYGWREEGSDRAAAQWWFGCGVCGVQRGQRLSGEAE